MSDYGTEGQRRTREIERRETEGHRDTEKSETETETSSQFALSVIFARLRAGDDDQKQLTANQLKEFSREGYRTLAVARREISPEEWDEWWAKYQEVQYRGTEREIERDKEIERMRKRKRQREREREEQIHTDAERDTVQPMTLFPFQASTSLDRRDERCDQLYEQIEVGLKLVGTTAIEDQLADQVPETIGKERKREES